MLKCYRPGHSLGGGGSTVVNVLFGVPSKLLGIATTWGLDEDRRAFDEDLTEYVIASGCYDFNCEIGVAKHTEPEDAMYEFTLEYLRFQVQHARH